MVVVRTGTPLTELLVVLLALLAVLVDAAARLRLASGGTLCLLRPSAPPPACVAQVGEGAGPVGA